MKQSDFQFNTPVLTKFEFNNSEKIHSKNIANDLAFAIRVSRSEINPEAIVEVCLKINDDSGKFGFWIVAKIGASFKWEPSLTNDNINGLLTQNAPALLISYLRPIVAEITRCSPVGSVDIPFIDVSEKTVDFSIDSNLDADSCN